MRELTDSEQNALARGRTELFESLDKTESNYNLLLLNNTYREAFTAGLSHADRQIAALEAERDGLRVRIRDIAWAALKYENATYLVKSYPSNSRYQRQLRKIHNIIKAAQAEFGPEE